MSNRDDGLKLLEAAEKLLVRDARAALADKDYNITVRRAQESVELALKGGLRILATDFPKIHDVGGVFIDQASRRQTNLNRETLLRIKLISAWLAEARTPSFYFERDYGEADAQRAFADATFVVMTIRELIEQTEQGTGFSE